MYKIFLQYLSDEEPTSIKFLVASSVSYLEMNLKFESLCNFLRIHYGDLKVLSSITSGFSYSFKNDDYGVFCPTPVQKFVFKDGSSLFVSFEYAE